MESKEETANLKEKSNDLWSKFMSDVKSTDSAKAKTTVEQKIDENKNNSINPSKIDANQIDEHEVKKCII